MKSMVFSFIDFLSSIIESINFSLLSICFVIICLISFIISSEFLSSFSIKLLNSSIKLSVSIPLYFPNSWPPLFSL